MSVRRAAYAVAGLALAFVVLAPLTSIDAAQQAGLPLLTDKLWFRIATTVAMFVVMASAWNIIGGLTGYASFGNVAFFGLGAYTAGVVVTNLGLPFALALVLAPLVAAAFAVIVGIPLLRLRGHYFAVATLGVGVAVGEVVNNIEPLGAATGLFLPIVRSDLLFFYLMLGAALLAVLTTWVILRTRFGYGLLAIRENEEAAAVIGVAQAALQLAIDWTRQRETFGSKLADKQAIQWMIADSEIELRAARLLVYQAAWRGDLGQDIKVDASICKVYATEVAGKVVDRCIQMFGGLGVAREMPLERWHREMRIKRIGEGPSEVHRMVVARDLLGGQRKKA